MTFVFEKIRFGVVELRAAGGTVYASPSFSQRIYLLWTFRNFHSLPVQVLNPRQQRLIDKLCHPKMVIEARPAARIRVIGVVENVQPRRDVKQEPAVAKRGLIEMTEAGMVVPRAAGAKAVSPPLAGRPASQSAKGTGEPHTAEPRERSRPKLHLAEQVGTRNTSPSHSRATGIRKGFGWALTVAAAVVGVSISLRDGRPSAISTAADFEIETQALVPRDAAIVPEVLSQQAQQSLSAETAQQVTKLARLTTPSTENPSVQNESRPEKVPARAAQQVTIPARLRMPPTDDPSLQDESRPEKAPTLADTQPAGVGWVASERLRVAEAPVRLEYPVAPNPTLTGSVSLTALIEADGSVRDVKVIGGDRALAGGAAQTVRRWRYRPHQVNGVPVQAETKITITFAGEDAVSVSFLAPD